MNLWLLHEDKDVVSRQTLSLSAHGDCLLEETFPLLVLPVLPHHGAFCSLEWGTAPCWLWSGYARHSHSIIGWGFEMRDSTHLSLLSGKHIPAGVWKGTSPLADSKEKQFVVLVPCINVALKYSATFLCRCRTVTAVFSVLQPSCLSLGRMERDGNV